MNSSPCFSIICAIRRHSTMSMPVPTMAMAASWRLGAGDWRLLASQYVHSSNGARRNYRHIEAPQGCLLQRRFVGELFGGRPRRFGAEYRHLRRPFSRFLPLSAEIEVEPSVLGEDC